MEYSLTVSVNPTVKRFALALIPTAALAILALAPDSAHARKPNVKRKGGQAEMLFGASACIPGKGECRDDTNLDGRTGPLVGFGVNAGWRAHPSFFLGAGYSVGWFEPDYELNDQEAFARAYQNSLFVILRGYIPLWRFDIGLEVSPGWSRQVFKPATSGVPTVYSQGFALRPGLSVDIWLGRQIFLGAKVDTIFNFHSDQCERSGNDYSCSVSTIDGDIARVHQLMGGIHIGGTF